MNRRRKIMKAKSTNKTTGAVGARGDGFTRRRFLTGAVGAGAAASWPLILTPGSAKAAQNLVWVGWGGSTQATQTEIFLKPFTKETGIDVTGASGPNLAKIKAMVKTGNVEWDLVSVTGAMGKNLERGGMLEPIPDWVYDKSDLVNPAWIGETAVGWYFYTGGIGFDPARHPAGKHPRTWKQFWDAGKFPGRRGLRPRAEENLEMALMADGVAPKDIYPIDVERAFKSMDRIKPHVAVWIKATAQTISLIQANEVDFDLTYTARVDNAQKQGVSIDISLDNPISAPGYLVVPKGAKNKDAAFKLLSFFMRHDRQLAWGEAKVGYSPQSKKAISMLSAERRNVLHDASNPNGLFLDIDWWGDNYTDVSKRFKEWLLV